MTKSELIAKLRESGAEAVAGIRSVPEPEWTQGRYENGWNARQILAHVASIEWTYPRLIELVRPADEQVAGAGSANRTAESTSAAGSGSVPSAGPARPMTGGVNSYNHRQVEKRSGASIDGLIAEFEKNRAATIAAFESVEDSLFDAKVQSAGGVSGTLAEVLNVVAIQHVRGHVADIVGGGRTS